MMQYDVLFTGSYHREVVAPCPAVVVKSKSHVHSRHFVLGTLLLSHTQVNPIVVQDLLREQTMQSLAERLAESASMQVELRLLAERQR